MARPNLRAAATQRVDVLGVRVSAINMAIAVKTIAAWIATRRREYVTVTGVHGVMESQADPELLEIHNRAGLVTPDGMPHGLGEPLGGCAGRRSCLRPRSDARPV